MHGLLAEVVRKGIHSSRSSHSYGYKIIHIILELRSQIPKSAPYADIMRIIATSKKDYSAPIPILRPNNAYWICERGISPCVQTGSRLAGKVALGRTFPGNPIVWTLAGTSPGDPTDHVGFGDEIATLGS